MKVYRPEKRKNRLDMLPLIDVVFLLLVFFIYAMLSMSVHKGVIVELPSSVSAEQSEEKVLSLTVKKNGEIFLDKEKTALAELSIILKNKIQGDEKAGVLIFGDKELDYQTLFDVVDKVKEAGIFKMSLQAEGKSTHLSDDIR